VLRARIRALGGGLDFCIHSLQGSIVLSAAVVAPLRKLFKVENSWTNQFTHYHLCKPFALGLVIKLVPAGKVSRGWNYPHTRGRWLFRQIWHKVNKFSDVWKR
jgi:hypothetical protein